MKNIVFLICSIFLISCSSIQLNETQTVQLELLEKYPLPIIQQEIYKPNFKLSARMLIKPDGSVGDVKLIKTSGDYVWDSKVIESLKKWKYAPPLIDNVPCKIWIQQDIRVEIGEPLYISFSQILCDNIEKANEVYEFLKKGEDFGNLALKYSVDPSRVKKGKIEEMDIHLYPDYLQKELTRLGHNEFSQPIRFGTKYMIVKRNGA